MDVSVRTTYRLAMSAVHAQAQFIATLPSTQYTLESPSPSGFPLLDVAGGPFAWLTVQFREGDDETESLMEVIGSWRLQP